jgi:hypothetical protein
MRVSANLRSRLQGDFAGLSLRSLYRHGTREPDVEQINGSTQAIQQNIEVIASTT